MQRCMNTGSLAPSVLTGPMHLLGPSVRSTPGISIYTSTTKRAIRERRIGIAALHTTWHPSPLFGQNTSKQTCLQESHSRAHAQLTWNGGNGIKKFTVLSAQSKGSQPRLQWKESKSSQPMASDSNPEQGLTAQPSVTRAISHIRIFLLRLIRNNTTTSTTT